MESSDSLVSQASSLPPMIAENSEYLPPALPPKRHRTNIKLNNLNITPPSSPKFIVTESSEATVNDLSSQSLNNNNSLNNNRNKLNEMPMNAQHPPISPSSNYVQISTSTINAAAAAVADATKLTNDTTTAAATTITPAAVTTAAAPIVVPAKITSPTTPKSNKNSILNNVSENSAVNNDVRVIYTNVNHLNTTNNRSSDENHYTQLYDGSDDDQKSKAIVTIECDTNAMVTAKDNDRCSLQQNSSQIINNNNNNKSINDKHVDDEEDIVVLRRPQASSNSSLKVLIS